MARTIEQILSAQIGAMALQQAQILAQAEALAEENHTLRAKVATLQPPDPPKP